MRDTVGGLPTQFWYLWGGTLVNRLGSFFFVYLAIYLHEVRGFSASFTVLVLGLYSAGGAAGVLVGGALADRWGRRFTLLLALYSGSALMLAAGFSTGRWTLAAVITALGFMAEMARPAFGAMMIDIVPERDRVRAFSLNYWAINLGFAFSTVVGGFAAQVSFRLLFVADAATTALTATLLVLLVKESSPLTGTPRLGARPQAGLRTVFADRVFLGFVAANLLTALVFLQHASSLPLTMTADGLSTGTYGLIMSVNGILIVAGQLFVPKLLAGREASATLALAVLVSGVGFGLTAFAHTVGLYTLTVLVWTIGEMLSSPANSALVAELSPAEMRGRYQGVFSLSWQLAGFGAPVLGGLVLDRIGGGALWLGCFALTVLIALWHRAAAARRTGRAAELAAPAPARVAVQPAIAARAAAPAQAAAVAPAGAQPGTAQPDEPAVVGVVGAASA